MHTMMSYREHHKLTPPTLATQILLASAIKLDRRVSPDISLTVHAPMDIAKFQHYEP